MGLYYGGVWGSIQLKLDHPVGDQLTYQAILPLTKIFFCIKNILIIKTSFCLDWCAAAHGCSKQIRVFYFQPHYKEICIRVTKRHSRTIGELHFLCLVDLEIGEISQGLHAAEVPEAPSTRVSTKHKHTLIIHPLKQMTRHSIHA